MRTEYRGAGPSCSVDSRFGSFPPRNNEISSDDERLKQLPIVVGVIYKCIRYYYTI